MLNFHQSQPFLNWLFPSSISRKNFLQDFPATISHKIFLQQFHARFSHKNFLQEFPARFSHKIFPQEFPARFSHKNFLQDFPARFSHKNFPQDFPAKISHKIFPQQFPARFSRNIFLSWILIGWLPITLFQMLSFHQSLAFLNWLFPLLYFPQDFLARISHKNFLQDFPELGPDWMAPHHPIPKAKFPPITAFLKLAFSPPPFSTRFSRKNFPQDFPTTISRKIFLQDFPELDPDWLAPHHPISNAQFPPITALLNRPTYHKRSKVSPPPFPQILWEPQINE